MTPKQARGDATLDALLLFMPFGMVSYPSIGLSLLRAGLTGQGLSAEILYFTSRFAVRVGTKSYRLVSSPEVIHGGRRLIGDWIFSSALFQPSTSETQRYVDDVLRGPYPAQMGVLPPVPEVAVRAILKMRAAVDSFLDECLRQVLSCRPRVVGFSCLYQQRVASLALARRIKDECPDTIVVFGGPDCEGIRGLEMARQFSFIDAVVSGYGEVVLPELVRRALKGETLTGIQGVYTRSEPATMGSGGEPVNAPLVMDMDELPHVNYDDAFKQLEESGLKFENQVIPFETSRGCWRVERAQCMFCGTNGANRSYRSKSGRRVLKEFVDLVGRYPGSVVHVVDTDLNLEYFKDFIPGVAARDLGVSIFFEVRSILDKNQLRTLSDAGGKILQPGIESLSSPILRLMRKGVSAIENIQFLKWCRELDIDALWSILCGIPGETPEEYVHMAALVPRLFHLQPPRYVGAFDLVRFSPYFEDPERHGFSDVAPAPAYRHVYPFEQESLARIAYYFTHRSLPGQDIETYTRPLHEEVLRWRQAHGQSDLFAADDADGLHIWDERPTAAEPLTTLSGLERELYLACDQVQSLRRLQKVVEDYRGTGCSGEEVQGLLQPFLNSQLMIAQGHRFLSLAIAAGTYRPRRQSWNRLQSRLRESRESRENGSQGFQFHVASVSALP